jgi:hypothetical protein
MPPGGRGVIAAGKLAAGKLALGKLTQSPKPRRKASLE